MTNAIWSSLQIYRNYLDFYLKFHKWFPKDQKWRDMRTTLSPAFTGSKMRLMYEFIIECAQQMTDHLQQKENKEGKNH